MTKKMKLLLIAGIFAAAGCDKSPLGPEIIDYNVDPVTGVVVSDEVTAANASPSPALPTPTDGSEVTCDRTSGHNVYYVKSVMALAYNCDAAATFAASDLPSSLTLTQSSSGSVSTVSAAGTAGNSAEDNSWSLTTGGVTTAGDGASITTTLIAMPHTSAATPATVNMSVSNNTVVSGSLESFNLVSTWDGNLTDVDLTIVPGAAALANTPSTLNNTLLDAPNTDLHGMTYFSSCADAAGNYVCANAHTTSGTHGLVDTFETKWTNSAFDQGSYYLDLTPRLAVEQGIHHLPETVIAYTVPRQTTGNILYNTALTGMINPGLDSLKFSYSAAFEWDTTKSTRLNPQMILAFPAVSGENTAFARGLKFARTSGNTISHSTTELKLGYKAPADYGNSQFHQLIALPAGGVADIGVVQDGAQYGLYYKKLITDATTFDITASHEFNLRAADVTQSLEWIATSNTFTDHDAATRAGVAYIRNNTFLAVAKINVGLGNGVDPVDDTNYEVKQSALTTADVEFSAGAETMDKTALTVLTLGNTSTFFLAYRRNTMLYAASVLANSTSGAAISSSMNAVQVKAGAFANNNSDPQNISIDAGLVGGASVVGLAWREQDANNIGVPRCFFTSLATDLTAYPATNELEISDAYCYAARIHYIAKLNKFLVIYSQKIDNLSAELAFYSRYITVNASAITSTAPELLVRDEDIYGAPSPADKYLLKFTTAYYPAADFVGIVFQPTDGGTNEKPRIHAFHVLSR